MENALETMQLLLAGGQFLFDSGLFKWSAEEALARARAMVTAIERSLGAEKGTFSFLADKYKLED